jgi:hypothetical protein
MAESYNMKVSTTQTTAMSFQEYNVRRFKGGTKKEIIGQIKTST